MNIISDIQDQIVDRLQNALVQKSGNSHMRVVRVDTNDEVEVAQWVYDNESNISKYPHAFVYTGPVSASEQDASRRMPTYEVTIRVFIAVRNASHENQEAQKRLADKWSLYVASALNGYRVGVDPYTADQQIDSIDITAIANTERSALWDLTMNVNLETDFDAILNNVTNE